MQIIWNKLYKPASSADQGTLYQLRNIIQRRNVVSDPKNNFNACSDFFNIILNAYIAAATTESLGCQRVADIQLKHLVPPGVHVASEQD
jgi:hypothetical protein